MKEGLPINEGKELRKKTGRVASTRANIWLQDLMGEDLHVNTTSGRAPEGWMLIGDDRTGGGICAMLGKTHSWVSKRIEVVVPQIQQEQAEGKNPSDQKPLFGDYLDSRNRQRRYYAPSIVERLKEMADIDQLAPEGWLVVGDDKQQSGIVGSLGLSSGTIKNLLPQVLADIEKEIDEQGVPMEEREQLSGEFLDRSKRSAIYYSLTVIDRLRVVLEDRQLPPEGWMYIGSPRAGIAKIIGKNQKWVEHRIPQVLEQLASEEETVPGHEQRVHSGRFINSSGRVLTHYSPTVIERLKEIAGKEKSTS